MLYMKVVTGNSVHTIKRKDLNYNEDDLVTISSHMYKCDDIESQNLHLSVGTVKDFSQGSVIFYDEETAFYYSSKKYYKKLKKLAKDFERKHEVK